MVRERQQGRKVNLVVLILVILLALLLIFSRSWRAARRPAPRSPVTTSQYVAQKSDSVKLIQAMNNSPEIKISAARLMGRVEPRSDSSFVMIDPRYASRSGMFLNADAYEAYTEMHDAAEQDGVNLTILSAMRTFDHQKRIWNGKWNGNTILHGSILATDIENPRERALEILRFSAMPGTSRHHWGTDIDLNSLQNSYFLAGEGKKVYDWLQSNASKFGFFQPYTAHGNGRQGGYEEEKWHWSYYPLSEKYLVKYLKLIGNDDITGFDGAETAGQIDVISNYVKQVSGHPKKGKN